VIMKKGSKSRRQSRATRRSRVICKLFSRKLKRFFSFQREWASVHDSLSARLLLRPKAFCEHVPESLTNRVTLLRMIGYQVQVGQLTGHTDSEVVGILSCYRGEKLEFQEELRIRSELIEKKTVVFRRTFQSSRPDIQAAACNTNCPYIITI